jgi:Rab family protein
VANKKDKESDREVDYTRGQQFCQENGLNGFIETSARSGENVEQTFMTAARELFKLHYRKIRE